MATGRRILLVAWALGCTGLACAQNLIVNGDFEAGNVGFSIDFFYSPGDIWLPGTYDVVYDVSDAHPLAELHQDHTTGAGLMLAVNAGLPNLVLVWSQTVPVIPGARYAFAAWAANWSDGNPGHYAPLDFRINGTPVAFWETPVVGEWFPVSGNWDAGTATAAVITILDFSLEWDGNAPALDDLWLALLGDLNCDGRVDFGDINPFATALLDPVGYHAQYANCNIVDGDMNGDGLVNVADINPFVALLSASPGTGACCYADDSCAVTTPASCSGTWLGLNTTCDASPCPPTGACCYADGACAVTIAADCAGTWLGANTTCDPHPCEPLTYCWGGAEYCREYISRVQIDTINNASGCAIVRYADYTYQATGWQALLDYGSSTTLTVTNGNPRPADVCSVWVDWNQDYEFDDASDELIGDSGGVGPYVFSLHPPMTALPGQTRMRIRIGCNNDNPNPCGYVTYGEVEDYTVNVLEVPGACCWPDGSCTSALPSACGGNYGGAFTACAAQDCNSNGADDFCDLANGTSQDCNGNGIPDECDTADGTSCDCQGDGIPDECQLADKGREELLWDDGSSEGSLGLTAGGELCWMMHFTTPEPSCTVTGIKTCFGTPLYPGASGVSAGQPVRVYVWSDPNGDGNPTDAAFLGEAAAVVNGSSIDSDVFQTVAINQTVSGSFFIGASVVTSTGYPAPMDVHGPQYNQAWVTFNVVPFDPTNITAGLYNMTDIGYPCNWLLRAVVFCGLPANDCNGNQIPDECDIGIQWGGYCPGSPDWCFPDECISDWNNNGVPDTCEICGDLDADADVDLDDYWIFHDAFGTCVGDPKYNADADLDGDGCVTLVDYQAWRMCYLMANGKEFVAPKPKPLPAPANKVPQGGADR